MNDQWAEQQARFGSLVQPQMQRPQQQATAAPKKKKNFWLDQISTAGGILGGIGGSFIAPLAGTAGGAAAGSALGEGIENFLTKDKLTKNVGREAAIGGILGGGPIKLAKAGIGAFRKPAAESIATSGVAQNFKQGLADRATTNLLGLTPAQTKKLLDQGVDPVNIAKRANTYGKNAEDIIGRVGNKGPLQDSIRSSEAVISASAKVGGNNVRIPGEELLKALRSEAKTIKGELGGGARYKAMQQIIKDAESKYSKGVTIKQARNILQTGNAKFGASLLDDSSGAVATAAQKLETNTMRTLLKNRFPEIAKALDDEAADIQLREILKGTRSKNITGGFKTGRLDVTRPGTFLDPVLNSNFVSRRILGSASTPPNVAAGAGSARPSAKGITARVFAGSLLFGADPSQEELPQEPTTPTADMILAGQTQGLGDSTEGQSMYSRENVAADIQNDLQTTGGQNMDKYIKLYEFLNPESTAAPAKPLSAEASKVISNANSGLKSLDQLGNIIGSGGVPKGTLAPGRSLFGNAGANILGTADFDNAAKNVVDVITRLRTGAALTASEEQFYKSQIPQAFDSPEVVAQKMQVFDDLFRSVASRTGSPGTDAEAQFSQYAY